MNLSISKMKNAAFWQGITSLTMVLVIFTFIGMQIHSLQHVHDGDVAHQMDCSACVKQGADSDLLDTKNFNFPLIDRRVAFNSLTSEIVSLPLFFVNSRSPPL